MKADTVQVNELELLAQESVTLTRAQVEELRCIIQDGSQPIGNRLQMVSSRLYFALEGTGWTTTVQTAVPGPAPGPVTQPWVHGTSMMQQSVLLAAIRGPDGLAKYGGGAKMLLRWYRRCILLSAMDGKVLVNPVDVNGGSFTGPSLGGDDDVEHWSDRMQQHVNDYLRQVDALPHHYQMHFMHAVEIVGYKHPDPQIRHFWHQLYLRLVHDFHLWPETEEQLDDRLGDTRSGWLKRADPATVA